ADPTRREAWQALIAALPAGVALEGVVHGEALGEGTGELWPDVARISASALALSQALQDTGRPLRRGLTFLTRGAIVTGQEPAPGLSGAALWGFARSLAQEAAPLAPRLIDLDAANRARAGDPLPAGLIDILLDPDQEGETALRASGRLASRLMAPQNTGALALPPGPHWQLVRGADGLIGSVQPQAFVPRALQLGEVRVSLEATALNFRDVLNALHAYPGSAGDLTGHLAGALGGEFCGRVIACAPDVNSVQVGDRVVGLGAETFAPETITLAELVARVPSGHGAAALAALPVASVTVELAFRLAHLKAGERVLVHAGAGGVGLAAIALARALGAEVIATASEGKRAMLRGLGVTHVFDSRSTRFAADILAVTGGAGVDVVLNSLTGAGFIAATLSCLAPGGRFVEIAKRDIWTVQQMAAERSDVAYDILAVDQLIAGEPGKIGEALRIVMARLDKGEIAALPFTVYPLSEAREAMLFMATGRHVGKIVFTLPPLAHGLRPDRTILVTGGLGGIGLKVAEWLAAHQAGAIVLNGRRPPDEAATAVIGRLRGQGARIEVMLADVTDPQEVATMLKRIDATLPQLGGVIHSVGILSDAALANQDRTGFERVMAPKVQGAWHLHQATRDLDLDLFVLFSSAVGVLGNVGQTNHAAANAFLDQLALHRRSLGLAGQAIAWGPWSGLGEAEEQRNRIGARFAAAGFDWITPQRGMQAFDALIRHDRPVTTVALVDWALLARQFDQVPMRLSGLVMTAGATVQSPAPGASGAIAGRLRDASENQRQGILVAFLQGELQAVLGLGAPPEPVTGFFELGMDSLMAVEFRNRLAKAFGPELALPNTLAFDYPSVAKLAAYLRENLHPEKTAQGKVKS
ncbi:MAG: hypothetical protein RLZZ413_3156, partial [Pseudomonadota bacterium]